VPLRLDLAEPRVDLAPLAAALAEGACAVIPTDTVYGLVCDAGQADACLRLSEIKRRDPRKPSTAMFASVSDAETLLAPLEPALAQQARALLGRGATVLVPNPDAAYLHLTGADPGRIGLRVSAFPPALATVIHELVHGTIYVPDHTDFNESLATFVGRRGALQLLEERHGRGSPRVEEAKARFEDEALFDEFIADLYRRLNALYGSDRSREEKLAERAKIFEGAREKLKSVASKFRSQRRVPDVEFNNAVVVAQYRYGRYNQFRRVFERVQNSWPAFFAAVSAAASSDNPLGAVEALAQE